MSSSHIFVWLYWTIDEWTGIAWDLFTEGPNERTQILRGNRCWMRGDYVGAERYYNRALRLRPESYYAYYNRGACRLQQNKLEAAVSDFEEAVRLAPKDSAAIYLCAFTRHQLGQLEVAIQDYSTSIFLSPLDTPPWLNRSLAWSSLGNFEQAIEDVLHALRLAPESPECHEVLGEVYLADGQYAAAESALTTAIQLGVDQAGAHLSRGLARGLSQNIRGAKEDYETVQRSLNGPGDEHQFLGRLANLCGDYAAASRAYESRLARNPQSTHVKNSLAWFLATCPDSAFRDGIRAVQLATQCAEASQYQNGNFLDTLAAAHAETGDFAAAIKHQTAALECCLSRERDSFEQALDSYRSHQPWRGP